jgi:plastocyanin
MKRISMLAAVAAVAGVIAGGAGAATPKLTATVADPLSISLKQGSAKVTSLKAGTYTIVVNDKSAVHNFHLSGPGVNKKTSVAGKGTQTWTVTLKPGTYKFVCDPHASFMKGSFTVT